MKLRIFLLIAFLLLHSISCNKNRRIFEVENIVKGWIGKCIQLPDVKPIIPYSRVKDTTQYTKSYNKAYKILLYTDSTGCTSCKLQLYLWKKYIKELNSQVDFMFYFHTKTEEELLLFFKREQFVYPIYIDSKDELNKLNKLPENPQYQCFLLNNNNKILSLGNPTHNSRIWELYKKIILGKVSEKYP
jgi:hypothetical protein